MPEGFLECQKAGGRIRTITLKGGRYMRVCYDKNNKSHAGEVRQAKGKEK